MKNLTNSTQYPLQSKNSVLFITLDSCRFDTFFSASCPNMKSISPLHCAQAPSHYTYGSHSAMFVGFTPGLAQLKQPVLNPKYGKLFKLVGPGFGAKGTEVYELHGRDIIEGFSKQGFATIGAAAMAWFDPATPTGHHLSSSFSKFLYSGPFALRRQLAWTCENLRKDRAICERDSFVFLNIGETHVPYFFEGAAWSEEDNPCLPFQKIDRVDDCRRRQQMCCEFVDLEIQPLLAAFINSTVLICGDHGDCWGEDGLWEHGISHPATLTVPLLARVRGVPIVANPDRDERDFKDGAVDRSHTAVKKIYVIFGWIFKCLARIFGKQICL